jgi:hypothetical protein
MIIVCKKGKAIEFLMQKDRSINAISYPSDYFKNKINYNKHFKIAVKKNILINIVTLISVIGNSFSFL